MLEDCGLLRRAHLPLQSAPGHLSVAFTMDVCSHIIEGMPSDAMALLDEVLPAGVNRAKNKINANFCLYVNKAGQFSFKASVAQG